MNRRSQCVELKTFGHNIEFHHSKPVAQISTSPTISMLESNKQILQKSCTSDMQFILRSACVPSLQTPKTSLCGNGLIFHVYSWHGDILSFAHDDCYVGKCCGAGECETTAERVPVGAGDGELVRVCKGGWTVLETCSVDVDQQSDRNETRKNSQMYPVSAMAKKSMLWTVPLPTVKPVMGKSQKPSRCLTSTQAISSTYLVRSTKPISLVPI